MTARDSVGLSTQTDFTLSVNAAPATKTSLETTLISAIVSGVVGLGFFGLKVGLQYLADKKLKGDKDDYDIHVVGPVARAIAKRVKITGFMDNLSATTAEDFKSAVRTLLTEISLQKVNVRLAEMDMVERDALVNEIATQTKIHLVGKGTCCRLVTNFFKAEATADDLQKKAKAIAVSVAEAHVARFGKAEVEMRQLNPEPLLAPELGQQFVMGTPMAEASAWEDPEQAMRRMMAPKGIF